MYQFDIDCEIPVVRTRGRGSADVPFQEDVPRVSWYAAEPQESRTGSTNTYGINRYMLTWETLTRFIPHHGKRKYMLSIFYKMEAFFTDFR